LPILIACANFTQLFSIIMNERIEQNESHQIESILNKYFPDLDNQSLMKEIATVAKIEKVKAGNILIDYRMIMKNIPLIFEGKLKIYREDDRGNELFLYYIEPGQGCAVSFACFDKMSSIRAEAVEDSRFISIPVVYMEKWMAAYPEWNKFVLRVYNQRFEEVLETLNQVAFYKLDERILDYLEKHSLAYNSPILNLTHAEIAQEMNTSREVISRLLKKLEIQGKISMSRNQIELL
jgi:CRP/FNR family transcriptional regulator, anaerobic regulatory protein